MDKNIVGFVFARGRSKGVPGKNIKLLGGKPLIAYSIETALKSRYIKRVIVSTDEAEIAATAKEYGAEVPFMRPVELAQDDSPEWLAWQHAIDYFMNSEQEKRGLDVFVSVPATSPLRAVEDIDNAVETLLKSDADIVITVKEASRNPSFNMVKHDGNGYASLLMPLDNRITRRQDAPVVFDMATVAYVARPEFIMNASGTFDGKVKSVLIPDERAMDIDTMLDFEIAEFLISRKKRDGM